MRYRIFETQRTPYKHGASRESISITKAPGIHQAHNFLKPEYDVEHESTSSSPNECLLRWLEVSGIGAGGIVFLVDTRISFVSRWILPIRAALACSSSSSRDCILTCPASNCHPSKSRPQKWPHQMCMHLIMQKLSSMLKIHFHMVRSKDKVKMLMYLLPQMS